MFLQISALTIHRAQSIVYCSGVTFLKMSYIVGWISIQIAQFHRDANAESPIEKRKRNLKTISPISRGERDIWISFPSFEKKKRNQTKYSQLSRREREIRQNVLNFREEKEKSMFFAQASRVEREILNTCLQFREEKENIEEQIL